MVENGLGIQHRCEVLHPEAKALSMTDKAAIVGGLQWKNCSAAVKEAAQLLLFADQHLNPD